MASNPEPSFMDVPLVWTPDPLPPLGPDVINETHATFREMWDITRRAYEFRAADFARITSKHRKNQRYHPTAGLIMVGLGGMFKYAERQVQQEAASTHDPALRACWNQIFQHVVNRWEWYHCNKSICSIMKGYYGEKKEYEMALISCEDQHEHIQSLETSFGHFAGLTSIQMLEDIRGWWRLMELCVELEHCYEYVSLETCRNHVEEYSARIASKKEMEK